jgi:hypothetical protein
MSSSGTPIAGTDHHEDDHAPYASLVPATAHALAIGDERVPSPPSSLPPTPLAVPSTTHPGHTQPKYAPVTSQPERSSNLLQITFEQTYIMVWKNLQVESPSPILPPQPLTLYSSSAKAFRWKNNSERIPNPDGHDPILDLH